MIHFIGEYFCGGSFLRASGLRGERKAKEREREMESLCREAPLISGAQSDKHRLLSPPSACLSFLFLILLIFFFCISSLPVFSPSIIPLLMLESFSSADSY